MKCLTDLRRAAPRSKKPFGFLKRLGSVATRSGAKDTQFRYYQDVYQLVDYLLWVQKVVGSSPTILNWIPKVSYRVAQLPNWGISSPEGEFNNEVIGSSREE